MTQTLPDARALAAEIPISLPGLSGAQYRGAHRRAMAGQGDSFWQYRAAQPGDPAQAIDWRRSARGDTLYLRQTEWEVAREAGLWCAARASMDFASGGVSKQDYGTRLLEAAALALEGGGERVVSLEGPGALHVRPGGAAQALPLHRHGRAVLISDFWDAPEDIAALLRAYAGRGVAGVLVHLLDPAERDFPYAGYVRLTGEGDPLDLPDAGAARAHYLEKLAAWRGRLAEMAGQAGFRVVSVETDLPMRAALRSLRDALVALR
ncbi:DUF58 domain-containing protein [Paracoccaceae bacterium GXU_MW_L88]